MADKKKTFSGHCISQSTWFDIVIFIKNILKTHPCKYILYVRNKKSMSSNFACLIRILVSIVEKNIFMKIIKIKKNSSYLV